MLSPSGSASGKFAAIDATQFVAKVASSLEQYLAEAKANDPAELKRQVATLQKKIQQLESAKPETKIERVEVPIIADDQIDKLTSWTDAMRETARIVSQSADAIAAAIQNAKRQPVVPTPTPSRPVIAPSTRPYVSSGPAPVARLTDGSVADLVRGKLAILHALARCHPMKLSLPQLGRLAGQSLKSSSFKAYLADVRRSGFVSHDHDGYALTGSGMDAIDFTPTVSQTADEQIAMWRNALIAGERAIFDYVLQASPQGEWVALDDISAATGQSLKSSSFKSYLSNLVRNRLVEKSGNDYRPAAWLLYT